MHVGPGLFLPPDAGFPHFPVLPYPMEKSRGRARRSPTARKKQQTLAPMHARTHVSSSSISADPSNPYSRRPRERRHNNAARSRSQAREPKRDKPGQDSLGGKGGGEPVVQITLAGNPVLKGIPRQKMGGKGKGYWTGYFSFDSFICKRKGSEVWLEGQNIERESLKVGEEGGFDFHQSEDAGDCSEWWDFANMG